MSEQGKPYYSAEEVANHLKKQGAEQKIAPARQHEPARLHTEEGVKTGFLGSMSPEIQQLDTAFRSELEILDPEQADYLKQVYESTAISLNSDVQPLAQKAQPVEIHRHTEEAGGSLEKAHSRRAFLKGGLRIASGAIGAVALHDAMTSVGKRIELFDEAALETKRQGKNPPNEELLTLGRQLRSESGAYILSRRTPEQIKAAIDAEAQQEDFLKASRKNYRNDKAPTGKRILGAIALASAGLGWLFFGGRWKAEVSAQNEQQEIVIHPKISRDNK